MVFKQFANIYLGTLQKVTKVGEVSFAMDEDAKLIDVNIDYRGHVHAQIFYSTYSEDVERRYEQVRIGFIKYAENIYEVFNLGHDDDIIYIRAISGYNVVHITDKEKGLIHG